MADRYQDRPYPADDGYDRGDDQHGSGRTESDPLAELARLIGQTDPFANIGGRANQPAQPRAAQREDYYPPEEADNAPPAGPPPWMQRVARQEAPPQDYSQDYDDQPAQDYPNAEHPLRRYAAQHPDLAQDHDRAPSFAEVDQPLDPSRYDDALYGQIADGQHGQHDPAYSDDAYAYQDGYDEGAEEPAPKRRGGLATVAVVLALAVIGTGAAFAYRTYLGSPRSGEPPIIKADTSPTKIVPAPGDANGKVPDRLAAGDGTEKIVPREEAPVDVNANTKAGPRMVFPPLNQNANPPSPASVAPNTPPPPNAGITMPNNQPRAIKTFTVRGDQPDSAAVPVSTAAPAAAPAPAATRPAAPARAAAAPRTPPATANANASANAPLSLSPQATQEPAQPAPAAAPEPRTHIANNAPTQIAPASTAAQGSGGYLVQVSSQKNEGDAQASYRVLQSKFPGVLGSHSAVIKRADLGDKGIYYRAMVGPFGSSEEASQFCGSLKSAGGQCVIQRN